MRRIVKDMRTVKPLNPKNLEWMLSKSTWMLSRSAWWTGWTSASYSKDRCDMLETIQATNLKTLKQGNLILLIRLCNRAIASYQNCTGYAKQWKHYRRKLTELLEPETTMYVDNMLFKIGNAVKFLNAAGVLSSRQWRVLRGASRYSTEYELLRMDSLKMNITIPRNIGNAIYIGLKDQRIKSEIVLKYCVIE